jgi:hypothetical protein
MNESQEKLWEQALHWNINSWKQMVPLLSADQLSTVLLTATAEHDPAEWKLKIRTAIKNLQDPQKLEAAGKKLDLAQISELLEATITGDKQLLLALPPLFVGLSPTVFRALLKQASPKQLLLLKQEAMSEALQHHLSLLTHELKNELNDSLDATEKKEKDLANLPLEDIDSTDIQKNFQEIQILTDNCKKIYTETQNALALAWNTNRQDLIELLSGIREASHKNLTMFIGMPSTEITPSTGLWKILEKRLSRVFENLGLDSAVDDQPAMEALIAFSIWYVKDYWEVGLLPQISYLEELELNPNTYSEQEISEHRAGLFADAEKNLVLLGLITLKDLKQAGIYSRKALTNYVRAHQSRLLNR